MNPPPRGLWLKLIFQTRSLFAKSKSVEFVVKEAKKMSPKSNLADTPLYYTQSSITNGM